MVKIALFGGTFDPIHTGHLIAAEDIFRILKLDKIIFVPTGVPPHKSCKNITQAKHRFAMVKLAIKGNQKFSISNYEIKGKEKAYSIDTVRYFKKRLGSSVKLYFIIGSDIVRELHAWKDIKKLIKLCNFIVMTRQGFKVPKEEIKKIGKFIDIQSENISSREIRRLVKKDESIKYLVPNGVEKYIYEKKLYRE
ncbi:MAG: nicotinate-nucleotide adenylyltransferase [Candidatus Firestonebacteria bacterium]